MLDRIRRMIVKEFLQLARDKKMLRILVMPPILQLLIFGYVVASLVARRAAGATPPGPSLLRTMWTSTAGISVMRSTG